jgi:hypothetical protein
VWLKQERLSGGNKPELKELYPSEDAMKRRLKLFDGPQHLFKLNMGYYQ